MLTLLSLQPARAKKPSKNGKIAFVSINNTGSQSHTSVRTVDLEGNVDTLIDLSDAISLPALSPNAKQIVYSSAKENAATVVDLATRQRHTLSSGDYRTPAREFSWSPDGQYVSEAGGQISRAATAQVYMEDKPEFLDPMYIVRADATGETKAMLATAFAWSPDSTRVVYATSLPYHFARIVESSIEDLGTDREQAILAIPITYFHIYYFAWSPNGRRILFTGNLPPPLYETAKPPTQLYAMNLDVPNPTLMVYSITRHAVWSPDSSQIAFDRNIIKLDGPHLGNPASRNIQQVIKLPVWDLVWSPDGTQIAFTSNATGVNEIYVVSADGSELRQLTQNSDYEGGLMWLSVQE
jgi:WD40 repeat protein